MVLRVQAPWTLPTFCEKPASRQLRDEAGGVSGVGTSLSETTYQTSRVLLRLGYLRRRSAMHAPPPMPRPSPRVVLKRLVSNVFSLGRCSRRPADELNKVSRVDCDSITLSE